MEKYMNILKRSSLFSGIEETEVNELINSLKGRQQKFSKGNTILHSGERTSKLGLVLEGKALIVKDDFWGNRNLLAHRLPGQCFAETFAAVPNSVVDVNVIAGTDCLILFLDVQKAIYDNNTAEYSRFIMNFLKDMAQKNIAFTEKLTHLGKRTTREKILSYLSTESQKKGSIEFDIPFSRQQLADYLLVDRSGLSAELSRMRKEGIIEFNKNHFILKH